MLALALVCSGIAYLLYFRLIANVGPTRAMTVTFLLPALGMMWGALFLDETVTLPMLAGALLIIAGTAALLVIMQTLGIPAESSLLARYSPTRWRSTAFGAKFVLSIGVSAAGVRGRSLVRADAI